MLSTYLKDFWVRRYATQEEIRKAFSDWGACTLRSIRLKRAVDRAVEATRAIDNLGVPYPDDMLTVKEVQETSDTARYESDVSQFNLVQLDPKSLDSINAVNLAFHGGDYLSAERKLISMIAKRARKLGKLPPIELPSADESPQS